MESQPIIVRKRKSPLRVFRALVDGDEFEVRAKSIYAAYARTSRHFGQGKMIRIEDGHLTLYGAVPVE
jgi:hypothetical protein